MSEAPLLQARDLRKTYRLGRVDVPVLRGVSFHVHPGQALALCGSSGSGKSSIIALLERFYEPSSGDIEVDGVPLASLDPSWWRRQIALVAQELCVG